MLRILCLGHVRWKESHTPIYEWRFSMVPKIGQFSELVFLIVEMQHVFFLGNEKFSNVSALLKYIE